jgi:NAD(P)-dependent dehydrogenase (short-subunit alcohol dehydrogenase family)
MMKKKDKKLTQDTPLSRKKFLANSGAGLASLVMGGGLLAGSAKAVQPSAGRQRRFEEKVVLITGATSGIGEATAKAFASEGASVFFCGRREELGREVETAIRQAGGEATYMPADVRYEDQVKAFVESCMETYGRVDIAFNNAGIEGNPSAIDEMPMEGESGYHDVFKTNVDGVFYAMKYELPIMREQQSGVIINTGSVLASRGSGSYAPYSASKHAVKGLTRSAAPNARDGIRVVTISPGGTRTDMMRRIMGGSLENAGRNNPMGRLAEPEEIAAMVMNVSMPEASYLNGEEIRVDGGSSA